MKRDVIIGIGEVLWDNFPDGKQVGGAPANFSFHAMALGTKGFVVSAVGDDPSGREILEYLRHVGVDSGCVAIAAKYPTGAVTVRVDSAGVPSFNIHENVAWDNIELTEKSKKLAVTADAVCFGTLAQRSAASRENIQHFLEIVPTDCLRVFDVNLRQSYYNKEIVLESIRRCDILKLNGQELPVIAEFMSIGGSQSEILRTIMQAHRLKLVALTMGEKGSQLVSPEEESFMESANVSVVDTVGAGDAFTAALTVGLLKKLSLRVIHENATRLAGFVCTQRGAIADVTGIREFMGVS